jgi:hypothetical protein
MMRDVERLLMRGNSGALQLEKKMVEYLQDLIWATETSQVDRFISFFIICTHHLAYRRQAQSWR